METNQDELNFEEVAAVCCFVVLSIFGMVLGIAEIVLSIIY
jgi:hypothetical protein